MTNPPPPTGPGLPPLPAPPRAPQLEGSSLSPLPPGIGNAERASPPERVAASPDGFTAEDAVTHQLENLEGWARANEQREREASVRFWGLHAVALVSAVLASASVPLWSNLPLAIALSGVAALCVVIEAVWSGPDRLGTAQQRAVHELRELEHVIQLRWDAARLAFPNPYHPRRTAHALSLLDTVAARREEIGKYLGGSHASPAAALRSGLGASGSPRPGELQS